MNQQVFTLSPPTGSLHSTGLGFYARAVIVDNYTSSYVIIPDAGATLPPWVYGAVVSLPPGINSAQASLTATIPAVAGPPIPASQCNLTWSDEPLPTSSGHLLQQSQYSQITQIGTITTVGNGDTVNKTFPMPAGSLGVGYIYSAASGFSPPATISVKGDVENVAYILANPPTFAAITSRFLPPDQNAVCSVTSNTGPNQPAQVTFLALSYNPTVNITTQLAIPVTMNGSTAAPWQAPTNRVYVEVSNGSFPATVVTATAGKTVYVHGWELEIDGAASNRFGTMYDSIAGSSSGRFAKITAQNGQVTGTGSGGTLTQGAGVQLTGGTINGEFLSAVLWYSQV